MRLSRPTSYLDLLAQKQRRDQHTLAGGDPKLDERRPHGLGQPLDHTVSKGRPSRPPLHLAHVLPVQPESWADAQARSHREHVIREGAAKQATAMAQETRAKHRNVVGVGTLEYTSGAMRESRTAGANTMWVCARQRPQARPSSAPPARPRERLSIHAASCKPTGAAGAGPVAGGSGSVRSSAKTSAPAAPTHIAPAVAVDAPRHPTARPPEGSTDQLAPTVEPSRAPPTTEALLATQAELSQLRGALEESQRNERALHEQLASKVLDRC